jgi:tetratricopeptide (TPR) repeat protein
MSDSARRFPSSTSTVATNRRPNRSLDERGEYAKAEPFYRAALAMRRKLYPPGKYPDGHPELARSLNDLGFLLYERGEYAKAEPLYRDALAMHHKLYSPGKYPDGHPELATSLNDLGALLYERGEYAKAEPFLREALAIRQRLAASFADASAEAEALNFLLDHVPQTRHLYLSVSANLPGAPAADAYIVLWQGKGGLARVLERRQRLVRQIDDDKVRGKLQELLDIRRQLANLVLGLDKQEKGRDERLQQLTQRKEDLEKELAVQLPDLKDAQAPPTDLADRLPDDATFVDLYRYLHRPRGEKQVRPHYVAFVLRKGQLVHRVELGPAQPIEQALAAWRQAIAQGLDSPAAGALHKQIWDKLAPHLSQQEGRPGGAAGAGRRPLRPARCRRAPARGPGRPAPRRPVREAGYLAGAAGHHPRGAASRRHGQSAQAPADDHRPLGQRRRAGAAAAGPGAGAVGAPGHARLFRRPQKRRATVPLRREGLPHRP